jgi:hypothetical protein
MTSIVLPRALTLSRSAVASPGADKAGDHVGIEPVGAHKQLLGEAVRTASEQF